MVEGVLLFLNERFVLGLSKLALFISEKESVLHLLVERLSSMSLRLLIGI